MAEKQVKETGPRDADRSAGTGKAAPGPVLPGAEPLPPALPPATAPAGPVDVTGIMPEGIRVDPDITEGHPGYQESGDSEIIPPERLAGRDTAGGKAQPG